jgi:hypothetical protein
MKRKSLRQTRFLFFFIPHPSALIPSLVCSERVNPISFSAVRTCWLIPFTKESFNEVSKHRPRRARQRPDCYLYYGSTNPQGQAEADEADANAHAYYDYCAPR